MTDQRDDDSRWDGELVDDKYRVFYGPGSHIGVSAHYLAHGHPDGPFQKLREVEGFVFVLRPDVDEAAAVALAAYAMAVRHEKPQLAKDLLEMINEWV